LWAVRYAGDGDQGYSLSADRLNEIRKAKLSILKYKEILLYKGSVSGLLLVGIVLRGSRN
jgi:hypothetical protein